MAGSIGTVIRLIPWVTLIKKAPEIIAHASSLLESTGVTRKKIPSHTDLQNAQSEKIDQTRLVETVKALEESLLGLNDQLTEAGVLIKQLAESNANLLKAGQRQQNWFIWLGFFCLLSSTIAIAAFFR